MATVFSFDYIGRPKTLNIIPDARSNIKNNLNNNLLIICQHLSLIWFLIDWYFIQYKIVFIKEIKCDVWLKFGLLKINEKLKHYFDFSN